MIANLIDMLLPQKPGMYMENPQNPLGEGVTLYDTDLSSSMLGQLATQINQAVQHIASMEPYISGGIISAIAGATLGIYYVRKRRSRK